MCNLLTRPQFSMAPIAKSMMAIMSNLGSGYGTWCRSMVYTSEEVEGEAKKWQEKNGNVR